MDTKDALTVADVIAKLQKLPSDLEVWLKNDESGHCYPRREIHFEPRHLGGVTYIKGWLEPTTVSKRRIARGDVHWYEDYAGDRKCKSQRAVVII